MGYRFVPEYNHAPEIHTCQFFLFFSPILAEPGPFVEIQKCCYHIWQRDVTTSPLYWQCFEDFLGGGASSVDCTYGLATKRYWTQHFNGKFLLLIRFPVISRWHMWDVYTEISVQAFRLFIVPCLKEIMVPGRSFNLSASKCLYRYITTTK